MKLPEKIYSMISVAILVTSQAQAVSPYLQGLLEGIEPLETVTSKQTPIEIEKERGHYVIHIKTQDDIQITGSKPEIIQKYNSIKNEEILIEKSILTINGVEQVKTIYSEENFKISIPTLPENFTFEIKEITKSEYKYLTDFLTIPKYPEAKFHNKENKTLLKNWQGSDIQEIFEGIAALRTNWGLQEVIFRPNELQEKTFSYTMKENAHAAFLKAHAYPKNIGSISIKARALSSNKDILSESLLIQLKESTGKKTPSFGGFQLPEGTQEIQITLSAKNIKETIQIKEPELYLCGINKTKQIVQTAYSKLTNIKTVRAEYTMKHLSFVPGIWQFRNTENMPQKQKVIHELQGYWKEPDIKMGEKTEKLSLKQLQKLLNTENERRELEMAEKKKEQKKEFENSMQDLIGNINPGQKEKTEAPKTQIKPSDPTNPKALETFDPQDLITGIKPLEKKQKSQKEETFNPQNLINKIQPFKEKPTEKPNEPKKFDPQSVITEIEPLSPKVENPKPPITETLEFDTKSIISEIETNK
jgi:hypothetical protein